MPRSPATLHSATTEFPDEFRAGTPEFVVGIFFLHTGLTSFERGLNVFKKLLQLVLTDLVHGLTIPPSCATLHKFSASRARPPVLSLQILNEEAGPDVLVPPVPLWVDA